jgi:formiminotetrahydrofolate cyclodeaminase
MSTQVPLAERTIGDYLETLGSSRPAPGGGSVAGLVGALAAGLGQMVISLTVKGGDNRNLEGNYSLLGMSIASLLASAAADELAYSGYLAASRLPRSTDDEKTTRRAAMQAALVNAAEVPLALATTACDVLDHLALVVNEGTSHALSDADIAISLAHASVVAGLANVRINIPLIKDEQVASNLATRANQVEAQANTRSDELRSALQERMSS